MAAEQQFLNAIQDKHSPLFHHYLTPAQWTARFGPSAAAQNAVVSWAKGAGLTVTHLYPNRLVVDLAGQVGTIEKALGVQINNYRLGTKTFFANNHDPVLPTSLSGIVESVEGLSSLQTMFPASPTAARAGQPGVRGRARRRQRPARGGQRQPGQAARGAAGLPRRGRPRARRCTSPAAPTTRRTSTARRPTTTTRSTTRGTAVTRWATRATRRRRPSIAIATFGQQQISDIQGFHNQYTYLAYNVQEFFIDGTPSCCDAEGTMDAEWSTAMSNSFGSAGTPRRCTCTTGRTSTTPRSPTSTTRWSRDNLARVFSTSWSCTELFGCNTSEMSTRDAIFSEMAGQGWTPGRRVR